MQANFEKLRSVGRLERLSTARHNLRFYLNAAVSASYILPDTCSSPAKDYIYQACKTLIGLHPILSAIPVDEDTNSPYFVRLPEIHLDRCVSFQARRQDVPDSIENEPQEEEDRDLSALLGTQHNTPFAPPDPFWRLCILTSPARPHQFTAAFVFHHALTDGTSAVAFHKTFQQALSQAVTNGTSEPVSVITSPSTPLLPNVEAMSPMPVSFLYLVTVLFKAKVWSWRDPGLWSGSKIIAPLETRFRHVPFSQADTTALINLCRAHDTTVTAALETIIAGTLLTLLPDQFTKVTCGVAVSTRRWFPDLLNDESMGVWVQNFFETFTRDKFQTTILSWDEARRSRARINHELNLRGKDTTLNLLRYINDFHKELYLSKVGQDRESSFELTNVGLFNKVGKQNGELIEGGRGHGNGVKVGRMVFSQSASVTGHAIEISTVTGGDGCLVLGFTWQTGVVEDDFVAQVMEKVKEEIDGLAEKA